MSIETTFANIAQSLSRIADALEKHSAPVAAPVTTPVPAPFVAPVAVTPVAVTPVAPVPTPAPVAVAPVPTPNPVAAPIAPTSTASPFGKDEQGNDMTLLNYVMATYRALGPIKGAQIQPILTGMGYNNINEVRPEHYTAFYSAVEALKVA